MGWDNGRTTAFQIDQQRAKKRLCDQSLEIPGPGPAPQAMPAGSTTVQSANGGPFFNQRSQGLLVERALR
jgi:hypothetical protein